MPSLPSSRYTLGLRREASTAWQMSGMGRVIILSPLLLHLNRIATRI